MALELITGLMFILIENVDQTLEILDLQMLMKIYWITGLKLM